MSLVDIDTSAIEAFEAELDAKIRKARDSANTAQGNKVGEVVRVDNDGTTWVHIYGGAAETPVDGVLSTVQKGDVVNCVISNGNLTINGNRTAPAASTEYVAKTNQAVVETVDTAIATIKGDVVDMKKAVINELIANNATINDLAVDVENVNTLVAGKLDADAADIRYAQIDFANMHEAQVDQLSVINILGQSGVFDQLQIKNGIVTGELVAVKIKGDVVEAGTIAADKIIYQGVDPETGKQNGLWYQLNATGVGASSLSLDEEQYRNALDGSNIVAKSVTAEQIDVASLTADRAFIDQIQTKTLESDRVQIGNLHNIHTEIGGNRFSFFAPGYSVDSYVSRGNEVEANKPIDGEVAFISVDENSESMFYITRAVVVKDLRFDNWKWYARTNGNMALKWIG